MNKETAPDALQGYIPPSFQEKAAEVTTQYIGRRLTEKVIANTRVEFVPGFVREYQELIREGYLPIVVANHASHADGAAISKLTRFLTKRARLDIHPDENEFNGFNMPMAMSLLSGQQGWKLRRFLKYGQPALEENGVFPLPLVREKDAEKYGLKLDPRQYLKNLRSRIERGYSGIVLFPEGTTEGGKSESFGNLTGGLKGMQPFEDGSVSAHIRQLEKHSGKKAMIIPVGISGGAQVINSDIKSVPFEAFKKANKPDFFHLNVGSIIRSDSDRYQALNSANEINSFVGESIASLLPREMRGVYGSTYEDLSGTGA